MIESVINFPDVLHDVNPADREVMSSIVSLARKLKY